MTGLGEHVHTEETTTTLDAERLDQLRKLANACEADAFNGNAWVSWAEDGAMPSDILALINAVDAASAALRVTAENIRSLGPAGALGPTFSTYQPWLEQVDAALSQVGV